ncbi:MAG: hypothetical protein K6F28_05860, partial [Lachnospiraceae bacterium]|nr:hypothetical protein [Lachnospiraceae bacterium]
MAQSTEDYLDSLLRQAMGISDPEPENVPKAEAPDRNREDVFAMADGLTGSNSAILGNAYDHNASFTNEGEIDTSNPLYASVLSAPAAEEAAAPLNVDDSGIPVDTNSFTAETGEKVIIAETGPDVQADMGMFTENLLPDIEEIAPAVTAESEESTETVEAVDPTASPLDNLILPDAPVIDQDEE